MPQKKRWLANKITNKDYPTLVKGIGRGKEYYDVYNPKQTGFPEIKERLDASVFDQNSVRDYVRKKHGREIDFI